MPVVDIPTFDIPDSSYLEPDSPYHSGDNHFLKQLGEPQGFPWLSVELDTVELESDVEDWKSQLSDILFSPAPISSASAPSSVSSRPATPSPHPSTATESLLSRFFELPNTDLEKAVDISSDTSYICWKCHGDNQPPSPRHEPL
jgi:hypothetical protein